MISARSERAIRWPVAWLLSAVLLACTFLGIREAEALPCEQCCEFSAAGSPVVIFERIFCPDPCAPGITAFCVVELEIQEFHVSNCPDAICALLTPAEAICCDDDFCRFRITDLLNIEKCTCPSCAAWILAMRSSGELFEWCLGEDRIRCEEEIPQCCDD